MDAYEFQTRLLKLCTEFMGPCAFRAGVPLKFQVALPDHLLNQSNLPVGMILKVGYIQDIEETPF